MNIVSRFAERNGRPDPEVAAGDPSVPRHVIREEGLRARSERERLPLATPALPPIAPSAFEAELGEYVRANQAILASATEGAVEFDPESPPERAVEIANLLTTGYETYVLDLRKVRAEIVAEAARHVYEIDGLIEDLEHARDRIAEDNVRFMHKTRNGIAAVLEARRHVATRPRLPNEEEKADGRDTQAAAAAQSDPRGSDGQGPGAGQG